MLDCFSKHEVKLQLEKLVIGLEEPILIKGVGKFLAKVDSGNGGYNVIHGQDVIQQGDVITFKTYDENDQPKMVSKKLKEFINVNIGSGNVEERPVIELDVKFAGELYKKIPFSVANRNSNTHKILICKDFVQKELDALIDVSGKSITKDKVEVEYVKENAFTNNIKDIKDEMKRDDTTKGQKAGYVARKVGKGLLQSLQQAGKFTDAQMIGDAEKPEAQEADVITGYADQAAEDSVLIKKQVAKMKPEIFGFDKGYKIQEKDIICFKLLDYLGKYFGGDEVVTSEKQMFDEYQQILNNSGQQGGQTNLQNDKFTNSQQKDKQSTTSNSQNQNQNQSQTQTKNNNQKKPQQQQKQKNESFIDTLGRLLTEATTVDFNQQDNSTSGNVQPNGQAPQQQSNNQQKINDKKGTNNKKEEEQPGGQGVSGNFEEYQRKYLLRNVFFTYFVLVSPDAAGNEKANWNKKVTAKFNEINLGKIADQIMINLGNHEVDQKNQSINVLFSIMQRNLNSVEGIRGTFAFCYTKGGLPKKGSRKCVIMKDYIVDSNKDSTNDEEKTAKIEGIKNYNNIIIKDWKNNMFLKNVKMDVNSKYDNEEKKNELTRIHLGELEKPSQEQQTSEENEESLNESFLPYLNRYINRVYGNKYYVTEDSNKQQEQKPSEENEKKYEEKQTGPTGEDALANVDFMAIAAKQKDKSMVAEEADKAYEIISSFIDDVQKPYFELDSETQKTLDLESFEPKVEDVNKPEQVTEEEAPTEEQEEQTWSLNRYFARG